MLSAIKTAIITIIISFISGVLLDSYKNFAPKIICTLGKGGLKNINNKSYREYIITVRNVSRKTLHDLNINIQDELESIVVKDTNITKGLRFELNKEYNDYNITVPFLSKSDEFIATIIIEESVRNKPYVALRSPEKFKKTYKEVKGKQKTNSQSLFDNNLYEKNDDIDKTAILDKNELAKASYNNKHGNKGIKTFMPKKIILAVIGILIFVYIGILEMEKIKDGSGKIDTIDKAISTQNQQNSTESSSATPSDNNKNKVNKQVQVEEKTQNKVNTSSAVEDNTSVQEETKTVKENNTTEASKENENIKANNNASTDMNTTTNSNNNTNTEEKQSTSKPRDDEKNNTSKNNSNSKDQNSNVKNNTDSKSTDTTNKVQ